MEIIGATVKFRIFDHANCRWDDADRTGYFHGWGLWSDKDGSESCAIVEEQKTGKVHLVDTDRIRFVR